MGLKAVAQSQSQQTDASSNTTYGTPSLNPITTGSYNTADGAYALNSLTTGGNNTANGTYSLVSLTTGSYNTANGANALNSLTTGAYNTANGYSSLNYLTTGSSNAAIGSSAGAYLSNGSTGNNASNNSVFIGYNSKAGFSGQTNEIVIGALAIGAGGNSVTLGNTSITITVLQGSVGIGTTSPNAYAILDVTSTSKAFVLPRMTTAQKLAGIVTPVSGMLVYDTTLNKLSVYGGASWETVTSV